MLFVSFVFAPLGCNHVGHYFIPVSVSAALLASVLLLDAAALGVA